MSIRRRSDELKHENVHSKVPRHEMLINKLNKLKQDSSVHISAELETKIKEVHILGREIGARTGCTMTLFEVQISVAKDELNQVLAQSPVSLADVLACIIKQEKLFKPYYSKLNNEESNRTEEYFSQVKTQLRDMIVLGVFDREMQSELLRTLSDHLYHSGYGLLTRINFDYYIRDLPSQNTEVVDRFLHALDVLDFDKAEQDLLQNFAGVQNYFVGVRNALVDVQERVMNDHERSRQYWRYANFMQKCSQLYQQPLSEQLNLLIAQFNIWETDIHQESYVDTKHDDSATLLDNINEVRTTLLAARDKKIDGQVLIDLIWDALMFAMETAKRNTYLTESYTHSEYQSAEEKDSQITLPKMTRKLTQKLITFYNDPAKKYHSFKMMESNALDRQDQESHTKFGSSALDLFKDLHKENLLNGQIATQVPQTQVTTSEEASAYKKQFSIRGLNHIHFLEQQLSSAKLFEFIKNHLNICQADELNMEFINNLNQILAKYVRVYAHKDATNQKWFPQGLINDSTGLACELKTVLLKNKGIVFNVTNQEWQNTVEALAKQAFYRNKLDERVRVFIPKKVSIKARALRLSKKTYARIEAINSLLHDIEGSRIVSSTLRNRLEYLLKEIGVVLSYYQFEQLMQSLPRVSIIDIPEIPEFDDASDTSAEVSQNSTHSSSQHGLFHYSTTREDTSQSNSTRSETPPSVSRLETIREDKSEESYDATVNDDPVAKTEDPDAAAIDDILKILHM